MNIEHELHPFTTDSFTPNQEARDLLTMQSARALPARMLDVAKAAHGLQRCPEIDILSLPRHATERELAVGLSDRGSDKSTNHNYEILYAHLLGPRRSEALNVFEVGLGSPNQDVIGNMGVGARAGASLRAFRDYLPRAQIYGADVDRSVLFAEDRITTFFVDQTDPATFDAIEVPDLDLVIDDGMHAIHANLATTAWALRKVRPGGWIVIEDINERGADVWRTVGLLLPLAAWLPRIIRALDGWLFVAERL